MKSTLTQRGQTTIPAECRRQLGLRPGAGIEWTVEAGRLIGKLAEPRTVHPSVAKLRGLLRHRSRDSDAWLKKVRGT